MPPQQQLKILKNQQHQRLQNSYPTTDQEDNPQNWNFKFEQFSAASSFNCHPCRQVPQQTLLHLTVMNCNCQQKRKNINNIYNSHNYSNTYHLTHLIYAIPQLCLIVIMLLSLLTVQNANCQQLKSTMTITDSNITKTAKYLTTTMTLSSLEANEMAAAVALETETPGSNSKLNDTILENSSNNFIIFALNQQTSSNTIKAQPNNDVNNHNNRDNNNNKHHINSHRHGIATPTNRLTNDDDNHQIMATNTKYINNIRHNSQSADSTTIVVVAADSTSVTKSESTPISPHKQQQTATKPPTPSNSFRENSHNQNSNTSSQVSGSRLIDFKQLIQQQQQQQQQSPPKHIPTTIDNDNILKSNTNTQTYQTKSKEIVANKAKVAASSTTITTAKANMNGNSKSSSSLNEVNEISTNFIDKNFNNHLKTDNINDMQTEGTHNDEATPKRFDNHEDAQKLMHLVMSGLGLKKLPNMAKMNISQEEYATKYLEYLRRVHERQRREATDLKHPILHEWDEHHQEETEAPLHMLSIVPHSITKTTSRRQRREVQQQEITLKIRNHHKRASGGTANRRRATRSEKTNIVLHFPLHTRAAELQPTDVEEANIRLMLIHKPALALKRNKHRNSKNNSNNEKSVGVKCEHDKENEHRTTTAAWSVETPKVQKHVLNLKVYQKLRQGKRQWLDGKKIELNLDLSRADETHSQWLQFDVTKAVETWLSEAHSNLGLEVQCDNCQRLGARLLSEGITVNTNAQDDETETETNDASNQLMPVLNIIARISGQHHAVHNHKHSPTSEFMNSSNHQQQHHSHHHVNTSHKKPARHKTDCHKNNKKCCRHNMEVVFKEIKGFEFIIHPKVFDAGYCHGRCPPKYNVAHNHAMLQSLMWEKDHTKVPKICCAPSKLASVEVLHLDETDSTSLKISTWNSMQVLECACS